MLNELRWPVWLFAWAIAAPAAAADPLAQLQKSGTMEFAAYADFPPFSQVRDGKPLGVDIEIGKALAKELGVEPAFRIVGADESVEDDLRNNVWKGHYLGGGVADVMLHVPTDPAFTQRLEEVLVTGPYYQETIVLARDPARLEKEYTLEAFTRHPIAVETASLADDYLLTAFAGRLREQVQHYKTVGEAAAALKAGEVTAVMGALSEIESGLGPDRSAFTIGAMPMPGLSTSGWPLGVAVKSENAELHAAVEQALQKLIADGTIAQIFADFGITHTAAQPAARDAQAE